MTRRGLGLFVFALAIQGDAADLTKGLGLFAGLISGSGFSYRQLGPMWGYQVTFGLFSSGKKAYTAPTPVTISYGVEGWHPEPGVGDRMDEGEEIEVSGNLGINGYRVLHDAERSTFYLLFGLADYGTYTVLYRQKMGVSDITDTTYTWGPIGPVDRVQSWKHRLYGGAGLGFLWKVTPNVRIAIEWPLVIGRGGEIHMTIPQAGIHYFFK